MSKMRSAIRIPGVAHSTLEYQRWAFRSQLRPEGRRFMRLMDQVLRIPIVQIHGELDPYVLTRTVRRDKHWAPGEKLRTIAGVGHYAHQEAPERVNRELGDFLNEN